MIFIDERLKPLIAKLTAILVEEMVPIAKEVAVRELAEALKALDRPVRAKPQRKAKRARKPKRMPRTTPKALRATSVRVKAKPAASKPAVTGQRTCKNCGLPGHYAKSCTGVVKPVVESDAKPAKTTRRTAAEPEGTREERLASRIERLRERDRARGAPASPMTGAP